MGARVLLSRESRLRLAGAHYTFRNATTGSFGQQAVQEGNTRVSPTDPTRVNPFRVLDRTADFSTRIGRFPLSLQAHYIYNLASTSTGKDTGYPFGTIFGKAKTPHPWELAYFYKRVEDETRLPGKR